MEYKIETPFEVGNDAFVLDGTTITVHKISEVIIVISSFGKNIRIKVNGMPVSIETKGSYALMAFDNLEDAIKELKLRLDKK